MTAYSVRNYFDMNESEWNSRSVNVKLREFIEEEWVCNNFDFSKNDHILDFACGVGRWSIKLSSLVKHVTAIDQASRPIYSILEKNIDNISAYISNQNEISNYINYFDKAVFAQAMEFFNDESLYICLKNIYTSLKYGGEIFISSWTKKLIRSKIRDNYIYSQKPNIEKPFKMYFKTRDVAEIKKILNRAGFDMVIAENLSVNRDTILKSIGESVNIEKNCNLIDLLVVAKAIKL